MFVWESGLGLHVGLIDGVVVLGECVLWVFGGCNVRGVLDCVHRQRCGIDRGESRGGVFAGDVCVGFLNLCLGYRCSSRTSEPAPTKK